MTSAPTRFHAARRKAAIERAKKWYAAKPQSWSRFEALRGALTADSPSRQVMALSWLRDRTNTCEGLTPERYRTILRPIVVSLARSEDEGVRVQATHLLDER